MGRQQPGIGGGRDGQTTARDWERERWADNNQESKEGEIGRQQSGIGGGRDGQTAARDKRRERWADNSQG